MHTLWLTDETREAAKAAVGWVPAGMRLRYWQAGSTTAWILEDIGKEKPITLGIAVSDQRIARVEVLAFRESRGWEIRYRVRLQRSTCRDVGFVFRLFPTGIHTEPMFSGIPAD